MTIKQPSAQQQPPVFLTRRALKQRLNDVLKLLQDQPGHVVTIVGPEGNWALMSMRTFNDAKAKVPEWLIPRKAAFARKPKPVTPK
jgi:hypothetical protein